MLDVCHRRAKNIWLCATLGNQSTSLRIPSKWVCMDFYKHLKNDNSSNLLSRIYHMIFDHKKITWFKYTISCDHKLKFSQRTEDQQFDCQFLAIKRYSNNLEPTKWIVRFFHSHRKRINSHNFFISSIFRVICIYSHATMKFCICAKWFRCNQHFWFLAAMTLENLLLFRCSVCEDCIFSMMITHAKII